MKPPHSRNAANFTNALLDDSPPPGAEDYIDSDDEMIEVDTSPPTFANIVMIDAEKHEALKKWGIHKERHTRKERERPSHVYWYYRREVVVGDFYSEYPNGPKILQEYKWICKKCLHGGCGFKAPTTIYESKRHGVTTGIDKHLKSHGVTKESHFAQIPWLFYNYWPWRLYGTRCLEWEKMLRARLTARESTRRFL
jgi:hypothetical protein